MTSLDPKQPLREPTPEERARAARMVWLIVLGVPTMVGVMVAYLTFNGRQVRDYGRAVMQAVQNSPSANLGTSPEECGKVLPGVAVPSGVQSCRVERLHDGGLLVTLTVDGGRQYQVSNPGGTVTDKVNSAEADARAYAASVVNGFPAWVKANTPPALEVQAVPCARVVSTPVPAGVVSCLVQSGPADGPQVAMKLQDGRAVNVDF